MVGKLLRPSWITKAYVIANRNKLFVFGDNMAGWGKKGQAFVMRDEPNAIGVPTKFRPSTDDDAYFTNDSWKIMEVRNTIIERFNIIEDAQQEGLDIVISSNGLGTGDGQLATRAPYILAYIEARIVFLQHAVRHKYE